jgi:uncharacterized protein YdaT
VGWVDLPGERNWVDRSGGTQSDLKDVALWLMAKGYSQGHAIAIATNVIRRWCRGGAGGDPTDYLNFPRRQTATIKTRIKGCKAVLEYNAKRAMAKAQTAARRAAS